MITSRALCLRCANSMGEKTVAIKPFDASQLYVLWSMRWPRRPPTLTPTGWRKDHPWTCTARENPFSVPGVNGRKDNQGLFTLLLKLKSVNNEPSLKRTTDFFPPFL